MFDSNTIHLNFCGIKKVIGKADQKHREELMFFAVKQWGMKGRPGMAEGRSGTAACSAGVCDDLTSGAFSIITG